MTKDLPLLVESRYGPVMRNPKKPVDLPPAVAEWRKQEEAWNAQASAWVRDTLGDFFTMTAEPGVGYTTSDVLKMLDDLPTMPMAWGRLVKSESASYNKRYEMTRNSLEALARKRLVAVGTTTNAHGRERTTTYARPRDESQNWSLEIEAISNTVRARALNGIKTWLALDGGSVLDGVTSARFVRRQSGGTSGSDRKRGTGVPHDRDGDET